jgi:hypothetical protein
MQEWKFVSVYDSTSLCSYYYLKPPSRFGSGDNCQVARDFFYCVMVFFIFFS